MLKLTEHIVKWSSNVPAPLSGELIMKWVSQVDKSRTGTQSVLEFPGQQKEQQYKQKQQQQQQEDQAELQQRHAELRRILDAPATDGELGAVDGVDKRINWIGQIVQAYPTELRIIEVCDQWRHEMADLNRRMRGRWTEVEKTSLILLLIRFTRVLRRLLPPLPSRSVYDPGARPATDHTSVVELFVSSGNSFLFGRASTVDDDAACDELCRPTGTPGRSGTGW